VTPEDEEIAAANEARCAFLASVRIPVPRDQMYAISLLEFLLGDDEAVEQARAYHERRIAPILDQMIGRVQQLQAQAVEAQAEAQEKAREQEARDILLGRK
jgi:hypothetical protein